MKDLNEMAKEIGLAYKDGDTEKAEKLKVVYDKIVEERRAMMNKARRDVELGLLAKAIPKKDMEDGIWYDCDRDAKRVARFGGKAKWDADRQMFLAPGQQQFGMDGWLDHWEDAIKTGYAGFVPMWKVEE